MIVDACAGGGGNAIQFAFTCERVIAIEIDPAKLACARHNAAVYGVADRIEWVLGDCTSVLRSMRPGSADVVFLAPPWGGPSYNEAEHFDVDGIRCGSEDGAGLLALAAAVAPAAVGYFLPRNVSPEQCAGLWAQAGLPGSPRCEVERHAVKGEVKTVCAYYGAGFAPA